MFRDGFRILNNNDTFLICIITSVDNEALKVYESLELPLFDMLYCLSKIRKQMEEIVMVPLITGKFVFS